MNKYPKVIQQIHEEFNTAADKLVQEAQELINVGFDKNKLISLQEHGFTNTKEYKVNSKIIGDANKRKDVLSAINEYKKIFPQYKFITEEQVLTICKKYSLIHGDIKDYTGFVPSKNLQDISTFRKELMFDGPKLRNLDPIANVYIRYKNNVYHVKKSLKKSSNLLTLYVAALISYDMYVDGYEHTAREITTEYSICAPAKDMNLSLRDKIMSFLGQVTFLRLAPKDPVVLRRVPYGFLVVTAWGDEAEDPILK